MARVRASDNRERKRFSALHEVKHTYLPGFAVTQYRCDPSPERDPEGRLPAHSKNWPTSARANCSSRAIEFQADLGRQPDEFRSRRRTR